MLKFERKCKFFLQTGGTIEVQKILLISILFLLTIIVWNNYTFAKILNYILPGDVMQQSILSNDNRVATAIWMLSVMTFGYIVPLVVIIICICKLIKNKKDPNNNKQITSICYFIIMSINILYYIFAALILITGSSLILTDLSWHFFYSH